VVEGRVVVAAGQMAPVAETDEALVERVRLGDEEAFEQLYDRFFKRVFAFVDRRLRNSADAEETVQEVFINVFNSIEGFRGEAPFAAWVFGVTRRTIAGGFKRKRHPTVPLIDDEYETGDNGRAYAAGAGPRPPGPHPSSQPSPVELYECEELLSTLETRLETRLSDEQRRLFQLHHIEDRPISEIARATAKSEDSVKSNLYRARKALLTR
jgi:RNA polymerase sigma-70 factor (ECF subfamily)